MSWNRERKVKEERLDIRITKGDREMLDYICYQTGKSKSEIVREALKMQYELAKYESK